MKILYHHRTRSADGQRIHIDGLVGALRRAGHEVCMVGPRLQPPQDSSAHPRPPRRSALFGPLRELLELGYNAREFWQLCQEARRLQPDAVYSRHALYACAAGWVARRCRVPWIVEVNAPLAQERSQYGGLFFESTARLLETRTLNGAHRVVVVTEVLAQMLQKQGVRRELMEVHPNGIDPDRHAPGREHSTLREELQLQDRFVLGFVGYVRDWNRLDRTFPFLQRHPQASLLVVGQGPDQQRLRREAERLDVAGQMRLVGNVEPLEILRWVGLFDVALLPEVTPYASPLKLLDYLAAGRAVLAPDRPNLREVLDSGHNGILFNPEEDDDFVRQLEQLYHSAELRQRLGEQGRRTIEEQGLTWDRNAERVTEMLHELCGARPVAS